MGITGSESAGDPEARINSQFNYRTVNLNYTSFILSVKLFTSGFSTAVLQHVISCPFELLSIVRFFG